MRQTARSRKAGRQQIKTIDNKTGRVIDGGEYLRRPDVKLRDCLDRCNKVFRKQPDKIPHCRANCKATK